MADKPLSMDDGGFHFWSRGDLGAEKPGNSTVLAQLGSMNLAGNFASLLLYGSHDHARTSETQGWGNEGSLHLGIQEKQDARVLNGATVACEGCTSGGQIVWNPIGYHYGIGIGTGFGTDMHYGIIIESGGKLLTPNGLQADADITTKTNISASGDVRSEKTVAAARFEESFFTPTQATSACSPGEFTDDQNFHYVCVSKNHWKRVELKDF